MSKKPHWIGDPSSTPTEALTMVDILGSGGFNTPGNPQNTITLNLGVGFSGESYTQDAMLFSPPGLMSIPVGPGSYSTSGDFTASNTSATAAQAVAWVRNDKWTVLGVRDTRVQQSPGNLGPGDTCLFATIGQGRVTAKADGTVTLATTDDQTPTGNLITVSVGPTGISFVTPWATLYMNNTGIHASTTTGAKLDMNGTLDPTTGGNSVMITAGSFTSNCPNNNLGPITGVYLPAVISVIPTAIPGVPLMGAGVGAVVLAEVASGCVNLGVI